MEKYIKSILILPFYTFQDLHYQQQQYEHQLLQQQQQQRSSQPEEEHQRYYQHNAKSLEFTQYKNLQKQHFIKNNLNNHINYSSNNFSNRKSVLYELKQYENFTNDSSVIDNSSNLKNQNSSYNNNNHNYNNNILNYNNNYYKINNLSSQNYIKNPTEYSSYKQHKYNNSKMHREETQVERSQLVDGAENTGSGNVVIHNFTNNNIINQNNNTNVGVEDYEEQNTQNSSLHRSHHFTQVRRNDLIYNTL